jgi:hypothetical protein
MPHHGSLYVAVSFRRPKFQAVALPHSPPGLDQYLPLAIALIVNEQQLDPAAGLLASTKQSRPQHPTIVRHKRIAGSQIFFEIAKTAMFKQAFVPVKH